MKKSVPINALAKTAIFQYGDSIHHMNDVDRIIRMPELTTIVGVRAWTIYKWIREGHFPNSVQLGPRAVGWKQSEVVDWINSRTREA